MNNFTIAGSIASSFNQAQGILLSFFFCSMCIAFILIAYKNFNQQGLTNHSPPICGLNEAKVHLDLESHPKRATNQI
jgi:hypothetical protein